VIAVANQKGGVGKSTTAVSLGASLAELGRAVLVVDLDPQGNASTGLGIRHEAREVTVYDVLAAEAPIAGAIVPTPVPNLFAIPSTIDLAGAEIELVSQFSRELRLRKAIEPLKQGAYDFIFLDCPPSLGLLTVNALAAAEELIVPIQCEYYALEGLGQLLRNVRLVQQNVNPSLHLTGIVMTMYDPRTRLSEQVVQEVRRYFGERVYDTVIPRTVRLSEAPGFGQPITVYDPKSRGAESYRELAREVAAKLPSAEPFPVIDELPAVVVQPPEPHPMTAPHPLREAYPVEPEEEVEEPAAGLAGEPEAAEPALSPPTPELESTAEAIAPEPAPQIIGESEPLAEVEAAHGYSSAVVEPAVAEVPIEVQPEWNAVEAPVEARVEASPPESSPARPQPEYRSTPESAQAANPEAWLAALEAQAQAEAQGAPEAVEPTVSVEALLEAEPGPEERAETGEVVVIRDRDAAGDHSIGAEDEGKGEGDDASGKRRWGLFRRGGGR
jgi:chromosome partitioning protein